MHNVGHRGIGCITWDIGGCYKRTLLQFEIIAVPGHLRLPTTVDNEAQGLWRRLQFGPLSIKFVNSFKQIAILVCFSF